MSGQRASTRKNATRRRPATSDSSAAGLRALCAALIIAIAILALHSRTLVGKFLADDGELVTRNIIVRSSDGPYRAWCTSEPIDYWPATNTMFWIEWRLWGANPTGYHVTNVILHIAESLLIWLILRKLSIPGALLAGVIFAIHPVNVESVAWIAQGKNLMCMLFLLLSMLWYLDALRSHGARREKNANGLRHPSSFIPHPSSFYFLSLAASALSMLSKGSAVVVPVLMLGMVWWLRPLKLRDIAALLPFFALAAVLAVVNVWFQTHGSHDATRSADFTDRLLGAGGVLWFYLYKATIPLNLAFIYPEWHIETGKLLWWLPLTAALAVSAVLWWYRATWSRPFLFAWGFFCVALAPVLGFTDVGFMKFSLVSDHYQHIAVIGVIALASAGWAAWHRLARSPSLWPRAAALAALGILALLTWRQTAIYGDAIALYRDTLQRNPLACFASNNLGLALFEAGRTAEAIDMYEQSLTLDPDYTDAHCNLGLALNSVGRFDEAIDHYKRAISLKPDYAIAWNNLGLTLARTGRLVEAIADYEQALRLSPEYADIHSNLATALMKSGRPEEAITHYRRSLAIEPDKPEYHFNLANALTRTGARNDGIEQYKEALRLNPDYFAARNNLGTALLRAGNVQEGISHLEKASQLRPDDVNCLSNLGRAYAEAHQPSHAIATLERAITLAKSKGKSAQAEDLENWLNAYRAAISNTPTQRP